MNFRLPFVSRQLFEQLEADLQRLSEVVNEQHAIISAQREALSTAGQTAADSAAAEVRKPRKPTVRRARRAKAA